MDLDLGILLTGSFEQGFIFGIMAIGVYLTFRILDFPDLTVDGSFALGGAVAASLIVLGWNPLLATLMSLVAGGIAGGITGLLHTKGKINGLLAGILTMIALYSINIRVMGKPNVPLLRSETLVTWLDEGAWLKSLPGWFQAVFLSVVFLVLVLIIKWLIDWFLYTDLGMAIRATGDNPAMISSLGVNTDNTILIGLILSNALVGFSGGLMAQYQGYADVQMGIGMIVVGLASVIIGEVLFGSGTIRRATLAVIAGALLYRLVIAFALQVKGFNPSDLKLMTAIILTIALILPRILEQRRKKSAARAVAEKPAGGETNA